METCGRDPVACHIEAQAAACGGLDLAPEVPYLHHKARLSDWSFHPILPVCLPPTIPSLSPVASEYSYINCSSIAARAQGAYSSRPMVVEIGISVLNTDESDVQVQLGGVGCELCNAWAKSKSTSTSSVYSLSDIQ